MAAVEAAAVERMTSALFIDKSWRSPSATRFWGLLVLAAIIASAGVVADSTATVIGAMIVAPLMTPILGSALAVVRADRRRLLRSVLLVVCALLLLIAVPLTTGTLAVARDCQLVADATPVANRWAADSGWEVASVEALGGVVVVSAVGIPRSPPPPNCAPSSTRTACATPTWRSTTSAATPATAPRAAPAQPAPGIRDESDIESICHPRTPERKHE